MELVDARAELFDRHQQLRRRFVNVLSFLGQGETRPSALAQPGAEASLQVADVFADRRTRDAEFRLGGGKTAAFHDHSEHAEQSQLEVGNLSQE